MKFRNDTADQRAWYFYDWANSAYVTTTTTVLFGPYLTSVAERAVGCDGAPGQGRPASQSGRAARGIASPSASRDSSSRPP